MNRKVLIYCPVFLPQQTGYSHAFANLVQNLLNEGFLVDVLIPGVAEGAEPMSHPHLRIIRKTFALNIWMLGLFYQYFCLAQYIYKLHRSNQYRVIFIETGDHPLLIAFMREQLLHKTVVRFHSTSDTEYLVSGRHFKYRLKRVFWKLFAAPRIKNLCSTSNYHLNYAAENIIGHRAFNYDDVVVNTISLNAHTGKSDAEGRVFFMLGRMDEEGYRQKGFEPLLDALRLVGSGFERTKSKLIIVGDGVWHEHFKNEVSRYGFVELHRSMPHHEIIKVLSKVDVVLLPSLYEGVSMFALEALGYGKAVIFSKTGGLIGMVADNGILVEPGNHIELANAIDAMLYTDKLDAFKNNSLKRALTGFSPQKQMEQFNNMLSTLSH
ncbi:MAG: glycosyltransferase family 4 protein [Bacteroidota bacterium]